MKKRILSVLLVVAMLVGMVPAVSGAEFVASVTIDGVSENYPDLQSAVDAISRATGEEILLTLLADVETDTEIVIRDGKFTFDLAGKCLTNHAAIAINIHGGEVTLDDSVGGGVIEATGQSRAISNYATLEINGGTVKGYFAVRNDGELTVNDGTFIGDVRQLSNSGTAIINGGTFLESGEGSNDGIMNDEGASLTVTDGTFRSKMTLLSFGTAQISGGTFEASGYAALSVRGGMTTVTGGSFTGTDRDTGTFTGVPNGEYTVEQQGDGVLVLKGGEFPNGFAAMQEFSAKSYLAEGYFFCDMDGAKRLPSDNANRIDGALQVLHGDDAQEAPSYDITVSETEHGTVTVDKTTAQEGETVTVTITPDAGYIVRAWGVSAENGSTVEKGNGYTFVMPNHAVSVDVMFASGYEFKLQLKPVDPDGNEIPLDQIGYLWGVLGSLAVSNAEPLTRKLVLGEYLLEVYQVENPEYSLPENVTLTLHEDGTLTSDGAHVTVEQDGEITWIVVTIEESGYRFALLDDTGKEVGYLMPERDYTATLGREGAFSLTWYAYDQNSSMMAHSPLGTEASFRISDEDYQAYADMFSGYGYEFNTVVLGVSEDHVSIDMIFIPIFDSERVWVRFCDHDGTLLKEVFAEPGDSVEAPEDPTREGYTFSGWDKDFDNVTEDLTVTAQYTENSGGGETGGGSSGGHVSSGSLRVQNNSETEPVPEKPAAEQTFADMAGHWAKADVDYVFENGLMQGMGENTFAPDGKVTRAMLVTVLYRAEGSPAVNRSIPFADVDLGAYYGNAVIWAQQNGIVNGVSETEFAPDAAITREQAAAILHRYAQYKGFDVSQEAELSEYVDADDVSEYALTAMRCAIGKGIIGGKPGGRLDPKGNTTRAELAAILHRFLEK